MIDKEVSDKIHQYCGAVEMLHSHRGCAAWWEALRAAEESLRSLVHSEADGYTLSDPQRHTIRNKPLPDLVDDDLTGIDGEQLGLVIDTWTHWRAVTGIRRFPITRELDATEERQVDPASLLHEYAGDLPEPNDPAEYGQAHAAYRACVDGAQEPSEGLSGWSQDGEVFLLRNSLDLLAVLIPRASAPHGFEVVTP